MDTTAVVIAAQLLTGLFIAYLKKGAGTELGMCYASSSR